MNNKTKFPYIVEESMYPENLQKRVSDLMNVGYVPHGSLIVTKDNSYNNVFYQAMILKKDDKQLEIL